MIIQLNGEQRQFEDESLTLGELLVIAKVETPELVTVQVNREFVDRSLYSSTQIHNNDEVDFLYFLGGGLSG